MPTGHALLNLESLAAIAFGLVLFGNSTRATILHSDRLPERYWLVFPLVFAVILAAYWRILGTPFVYDDYTHITDASHSTWRTIAASFGPVERPPGLFYRPFGFLVYQLNYWAAGVDPRLWHASSLLFHAVNACLLFALCRALRLGWTASLAASLVFAISAAAAEAVSWIDARFDPMSTALVLGSLLCVCRYLKTGGPIPLGLAVILGGLAFMTKESAFCLPGLAACLWIFRAGPDSRARLIAKRFQVALGLLGATAGAMFVYRWWALGGIGGYRNAAGGLDIGAFHWKQTLNAIFVRDWTVLFFPLNWSILPHWPVGALLLLAPLVAIALLVPVPRPALCGSIALVLTAALPVQHLLLIGTDLANARILYLLLVGWAILWGVVFDAIPNRGWRTAAVAWMLACQALMLHHNLSFWLRVPEEARAVCRVFGATLPAGSPDAIVGGLPRKKDGVPFLANGFPECVAMNSALSAGRVAVDGSANFAWNGETGEVVAVDEP